MRYEIRVAIRYLRSSGLQTVLILLATVAGIVAFVFIASLINGLQDQLIDDVLGNIAHIRLEPEDHVPVLIEPIEGAEVLLARQETRRQREEIEGWRGVVEMIEAMPEVTAVSAQAVGGGFIVRGGERLPVSLSGVEPEKVSAILDVEGNLVRGTAAIGPADAVVGGDLADELDLDVGQRIRVRSEENRERSLTVRGIFDLGIQGLNEQLVILDLRTAESLLGLERGVTQIEIKVADIFTAEEIARTLAAVTGLEATSWQEENSQFEDALSAQNQSSNMIKLFTMITIVIAVAGVLQVAALRRLSEIGIMRSMGVRRRSIMAMFILQGLFVGLVGSSIGSFVGWVFVNVVRRATLQPDGTSTLPVDPAQGEYGIAIAAATIASAVAAILPAWSASRVDPVEVLQQ